MSEAWKNWEGQVVDLRFPLRRLLGESNHSAVFETVRADQGGAKAAIKLIAASGNAAEEQLRRWRQVARISQPNILSLYHYGKCQLGGLDLLFAVMEFADETLGEILPQRALSAEEARQMLEPVLGGLVFLHQQGLVHGDIQPANIFAVGDTIKLSSDTIRPISQSSAGTAPGISDDARPSARGSVEPAGDIYSLGITIVQALTQRSPFDAGSSLGQTAEPLPAPFADIVLHALHPDPQLRWTAADIAVKLNPALSVAAASLAAPSRPAPAAAKSETKQERTAPKSTAAATAVPTRPPVAAGPPTAIPLSPVAPLAKQARTGAPQASSLLRYAVPIAVAVILLLMASRVFHRNAGSSASDATIAKSAPGPRAVEAKSATPATAPPQSSKGTAPASHPVENAAPKAAPAKIPAPEVAAAVPAAALEQKPAAVASETSDKVEAQPTAMRAETRAPASAPSASPEILQQVLPDVSQKALSTIHGAVRLTIRAQVDAEGKVADAQLETPSGSSFFNDLALKAARRWQFQPSESASHGTPRAYLLRFQFTQAGPKASATPAN